MYVVCRADLIEVVLLHLVHSICNLLGFSLFIRLDLLDAWGVPFEIGIVWRSSGKGTLGGVVTLGQIIFDCIHCVGEVVPQLS